MVDDGEWDPRKAAANLKKHGGDFADAATVLLLVVVYTWRGERPRLISARKAKPQEREQYGVQP